MLMIISFQANISAKLSLASRALHKFNTGGVDVYITDTMIS